LTIQSGKAHAAKAKRGGFPIKGSKLSVLHGRTLFRCFRKGFYSWTQRFADRGQRSPYSNRR
jgi:hypothetical protein